MTGKGTRVMDRVSYKRMYEKAGMEEKVEGMRYSVVEWMKRNLGDIDIGKG